MACFISSFWLLVKQANDLRSSLPIRRKVSQLLLHYILDVKVCASAKTNAPPFIGWGFFVDFGLAVWILLRIPRQVELKE